MIVKIERRPQPPELRQGPLRRGLRFGCADRADPPASITRAAASTDVNRLPIDGHRPGPFAILGQPRIVHQQARPVAAREARLLDRPVAHGQGDVGGDRAVIVAYDDPDLLQRLDNFHADRADEQHRTFALHPLRCTEIILLAANRDAKGGVHDVKLWIDAQRRGEKDAPVGRIAVEEITVVEIAVSARNRNRLGRLVQRVIITPGKHRPLSLFAPSSPAGKLLQAAIGVSQQRAGRGRRRRGVRPRPCPARAPAWARRNVNCLRPVAT